MMKLWLLKIIKHEGYDTYDAHVVRAETEEAARNMVPAGVEGRQTWLNLSKSTCVRIEEDGVAGVLISSFNAG